MPPVRGTDILRLNLRGAGRAAADLDRFARALQDEMNAELRQFGVEAETIYRDHASEDTGQLESKIRAVPFFRTLRPRLRIVVEPLDGHQGELNDGYDYLGVTRRGHRKRLIRPKRGAALKIHYMGHRNPHIYVFRASTRGVGRSGGPIIDWVTRAESEIHVLEANMERRLGRRIERRAL